MRAKMGAPGASPSCFLYLVSSFLKTTLVVILLNYSVSDYKKTTLISYRQLFHKTLAPL